MGSAENDNRQREPRAPRHRLEWWWLILVALVALPSLAVPMLRGAIPAQFEELRFLLMLFPWYGIASALFACVCRRYGRTDVGWVLIALALLSDAAVAGAAMLI